MTKTKLATPEAIQSSKREKRINGLKLKCTNYKINIENRMRVIRQCEAFTQMLLAEGRTTKEELQKYFEKK